MATQVSMDRLLIYRDEGGWALAHLNLGKEGTRAWNEFVAGMVATLEWVFEGMGIQIHGNTLSEHIAGMKARLNGDYTVSLDTCMEGHVNLGISRIFSPGGVREKRLGIRPGYPSLEWQLRGIEKPITILEDDIFTGGTILQVMETMRRMSIVIERIVCGNRVGEQQIGNVPVEALWQYSAQQVFDVIDPRDLLVGARDSGLVFEYHDGRHVRAPYMLPFVDPNARTGVPKNKALEYSIRIWRLNEVFWENFPQVAISEIDPHVALLLERFGFAREMSMLSVCKQMHAFLREVSDCQTDVEVFGNNTVGLICVDLNSTLIDNKSANVTISPEILRSAINDARNSGWMVALCSDSPEKPLSRWGRAYGFAEQVIAENGRIFAGIPISRERSFDCAAVKARIKKFLDERGIPFIGEVLAPEFEPGQKYFSGVGFGSDRSQSVSVFCFDGSGLPDHGVASQIGEFLQQEFVPEAVDVAPRTGFCAVHQASNFRHMKRITLNSLGWQMYQKGLPMWMIGDSKSDLTHGHVLCKTGIVGNAKFATKAPADSVASRHFTAGVIELIKKIIHGNS